MNKPNKSRPPGQTNGHFVGFSDGKESQGSSSSFSFILYIRMTNCMLFISLGVRSIFYSITNNQLDYLIWALKVEYRSVLYLWLFCDWHQNALWFLREYIAVYQWLYPAVKLWWEKEVPNLVSSPHMLKIELKTSSLTEYQSDL